MITIEIILISNYPFYREKCKIVNKVNNISKVRLFYFNYIVLKGVYVLVYFNVCFFKVESYFYLYTISQLSSSIYLNHYYSGSKMVQKKGMAILNYFNNSVLAFLIHWHFSKIDARNLYINCSIILMSAVVILKQAEVCKGCSEVYQPAGKLIVIYNPQCVLESWRKFWVRFSTDVLYTELHLMTI